MHASLRWALGITVALSAVALWTEGTSRGEAVQAIVRPAQAVELVPASPLGAARAAHADAQALPQEWPQVVFEQAQRDIFAAMQPPPAAAPPAAVVPAPVIIPPAPQAPALTYTFLGRMTDPTGRHTVYLSKDDKAVPVSVGTPLEEGYVVESISEEAVQLHYPPLDVRATIRVPPVERQQQQQR